jgi:hypothetical protein
MHLLLFSPEITSVSTLVREHDPLVLLPAVEFASLLSCTAVYIQIPVTSVRRASAKEAATTRSNGLLSCHGTGGERENCDWKRQPGPNFVAILYVVGSIRSINASLVCMVPKECMFFYNYIFKNLETYFLSFADALNFPSKVKWVIYFRIKLAYNGSNN